MAEQLDYFVLLKRLKKRPLPDSVVDDKNGDFISNYQGGIEENGINDIVYNDDKKNKIDLITEDKDRETETEFLSIPHSRISLSSFLSIPSPNSLSSSLSSLSSPSISTSCLSNLNTKHYQISTNLKNISNLELLLSSSQQSLSDNIMKKLNDYFLLILNQNKGKEKHYDHSLLLSLLPILFSYLDLYFIDLAAETMNSFRFVYIFHIVNHILKSHYIIHQNNLSKEKDTNKELDRDEFRDRGLSSTRVLILCPFRNHCFQIINQIIEILQPKQISNYNRFVEEFGEKNIKHSSSFHSKPLDYQYLFNGNIDDYFHIGIYLSSHQLSLYSPFIKSDIIISSPLAYRNIIIDNKEKDLLCSIEILVLDSAHLFLYQNLQFLYDILDSVNSYPTQSYDIDYSRVYDHILSQESKGFRQNIIISEFSYPQMNMTINRYFQNKRGKIRIEPLYESLLSSLSLQIRHIFQKYPTKSINSHIDDHFQYFNSKILSKYIKDHLSHVLIVFPSYYDFLRFKSHIHSSFTSSNIIFLSEYSNQKTISKNRNLFYSGLSLSISISSLRYSPPFYSILYSEIVSQLTTLHSSSLCLYSQYEYLNLERIVGSQQSKNMINSLNELQIFISNSNID